ncbi:hypothetical protein PHISP_03826 [Aspergillus sp. HF37]|nr:hypothetical protein PHISP_03826 [Aspergillus sp. HF37]
MTSRQEREAEDSYERDNDASPVPGDVHDDSYTFDTKGPMSNRVPVQRDEADHETPMQAPYSNTDQQLADDEREAVDPSNVMKGDRLRHAKPRTQNKYDEGPDEGDLPKDVRDGLVGVSGTRRVT